MKDKTDLVSQFFQEALAYQELCDRLPSEDEDLPEEELLDASRERLKEFARELLTELMG